MKENDDHRDYPNLVDNFDFALQDVGGCHTFDDSSAIIERAGILVEDYERRGCGVGGVHVRLKMHDRTHCAGERANRMIADNWNDATVVSTTIN
jgi:hypothetical protein